MTHQNTPDHVSELIEGRGFSDGHPSWEAVLEPAEAVPYGKVLDEVNFVQDIGAIGGNCYLEHIPLHSGIQSHASETVYGFLTREAESQQLVGPLKRELSGGGLQVWSLKGFFPPEDRYRIEFATPI